MTRLLLRPRASEDIDEHFLRIASDNPPVAFELLERIEAALERLREHPEIGSPRYAATPRLNGLRMWPIPEYRNYLIFYLPTEEAVDVLRILYGTQDLSEILAAEGKSRDDE